MRDRSWEKCFFVLRDAHSKWMDVYPVNSATSATTIECLRTSFSNHGLPELLVSDNNRVTPQTTTGLSPAELLLGRKLRCTLDLIHPDLIRKVLKRQEQQSRHHDSRAKKRSFEVGEAVLTRNFSFSPKLILGLIVSVTGPVSYKVRLGDGSVVRRRGPDSGASTEGYGETAN